MMSDIEFAVVQALLSLTQPDIPSSYSAFNPWINSKRSNDDVYSQFPQKQRNKKKSRKNGEEKSNGEKKEDEKLPPVNKPVFYMEVADPVCTPPSLSPLPSFPVSLVASSATTSASSTVEAGAAAAVTTSDISSIPISVETLMEVMKPSLPKKKERDLSSQPLFMSVADRARKQEVLFKARGGKRCGSDAQAKYEVKEGVKRTYGNEIESLRAAIKDKIQSGDLKPEDKSIKFNIENTAPLKLMENITDAMEQNAKEGRINDDRKCVVPNALKHRERRIQDCLRDRIAFIKLAFKKSEDWSKVS